MAYAAPLYADPAFKALWQSRFHGGEQFIDRHRLTEVPVHAKLKKLSAFRGLGLARANDHRHVGMQLADARAQVDPAYVGKVNVQNDNVNWRKRGPQEAQGIMSGFRGHGQVTLVYEDTGH